ncbi:ABC transporter ATP-binding protein [Robbsia sp. Bb-Pol-6]|uniref:ABC transporter ATP-binding protein n=1 Tax=Robbsia betulipollinis TaxID=2981849 RepID=A0ABT3ZS82_9BURK|nr:ABC transporter ATP-binding protein [Robbsia betulipollinis]MCY0388790.1 ABC transporter ATP-binding protein [Robbsia betulipollinis]
MSVSPPVPSFPAPTGRDAALCFDAVTVSYRVRGATRDVLHALSLRIAPGEAYGLVGESGCGKSTVALAAVRYLPAGGRQTGGRIRIAGQALDTLDAAALRRLRAHTVSMVYQDAARALNPSLRIGVQLREAFAAADDAHAADTRAAAMLRRVRFDDPARVLACYPHQLSGGMQQRVVIAMALATQPALLILDEPTTGLDATVAADILDLLREIRREQAIAMLFISHDLAVIEAMCDRVGVLYAGELVEEGTVAAVLHGPRHPYTVGLLRCLPHGRRRDGQPLETIPGALPPIGTRPAACIFADRCTLARARCRSDAPPPYRVDRTGDATSHGIAADAGSAPSDAPEHTSRCHYHAEAAALPPIAASAPLAPSHPASAAPDVGRAASPALRVTDLSKTFDTRDGSFTAVERLSFDLWPGETLGLIGESGSGKSTLARLLLGLESPDAGGDIAIDGERVASRVTQRSARQIRALQVIFQNPDSALNRAWTVRRLVARAIRALEPARPWHGWRRADALARRAARQRTLTALLAAVRLPADVLDARSAALSGGLKQRVAIARAFAGEPRVVICDEPTSALDVSVQAAILNLLTALQRQRAVSLLFISHDLDVIRYLADRIAVLYRGRLIEIGPLDDVLAGPRHPYTAQLLAAHRRGGGNPGSAAGAPVLAQDSRAAAEATEAVVAAVAAVAVAPPAAPEAPAAAHRRMDGPGCAFEPSCPLSLGARCRDVAPPLADLTPGHQLACHLPVAELPGATS